MGSISIEDLSFSYDDAKGKEHGIAKKDAIRSQVLHDINLIIPDGQFMCIIGHSGGGKSTLLRLLAGLSKPDAGSILIDGQPVTGPGLDRSIVFQNYSLFPWMRVKENVEFGIGQANKELDRQLTRADIASIADEYLAKVGMADAHDKYPYQLSGGMQQRVAIARALAMDTEIILFDEPFGALDVRTRRTLQDLVSNLWNAGQHRKTVVFVTHDISEALLLADRIAFMAEGEVRACFDVDLPRPRTMEMILQDERAIESRQALTSLFYADERGLEAEGDHLVFGGEGYEADETLIWREGVRQ